MKIFIPTGSSIAASLLLASPSGVSAHPGLDPNQASQKENGDPCPFIEQKQQEETNEVRGQGYKQLPTRGLSELRAGDGGIPVGGFAAVEADLIELMTKENADWPTDDGSYNGLLIRLAWHCAGSYRHSDGRGGCDGGRIRFTPESDWMDNGNLDKARMLLEPIKAKHGSKLSWGDLIILAGNAAIKSGGGPILGFCGGRIDDSSGEDSLLLGPNAAQEKIAPCGTLGMNGQCLNVERSAMGATTLELIYVNPGGPVDAPNDPVASGADIRKTFGKMGFDDKTSASLIGGGHAFGRAHSFTSGFEGRWTTAPTQWTNQYWNNLLDYNFTLTEVSETGAKQWIPDNGLDIFMLTADMAMMADPKYRAFVDLYATDMDALETDFSESWYRLVSSDMGPHGRCIGDMVPDARPFQHGLPSSPSSLPDYLPARAAIQEYIEANPEAAVGFSELAASCANTFRGTDYRGGCNGGRIRLAPESEWEYNEGAATHVAALESIKIEKELDDVSMTDMIVLGGITALETSNDNLNLPFCGGYVDAATGEASEGLGPRIYETPYITITDDYLVKGLSMEQGVALASAPMVTSKWYKDLLSTGGDSSEYDAYDKALLEGDLLKFVEKFASNEDELIKAFESGWTYMMTADRFGEFNMNECTSVNTPTVDAPASGGYATESTLLGGVLAAGLMAAIGLFQ